MKSNVIDLRKRRIEKEVQDKRIIYLHSETGFFEGLYYNNDNPEIAFRLKILFWGVDARGDIVALVPWLKDICVLEELTDTRKICFAGYYDVVNKCIIEQIPDFKINEIKSYSEYYLSAKETSDNFVQHIEEKSGTHGVFLDMETEEMNIIPIHSWKLYEDGALEPFVVKEEALHMSPILLADEITNDNYLESMFELNNFGYYFNYETAQKVKENIKRGGLLEVDSIIMDNFNKD